MNDKIIEYELRYIIDYIQYLNSCEYNYEYLNLTCYEDINNNNDCSLHIKLILNGNVLVSCKEYYLNRTVMTVEDKRKLCKKFREQVFDLIFKNIHENIIITKILENE